MRRCAAAIARAVVEFIEAVILGCLRSCFGGARPRRGSGRRDDALAHRDQDRAAEFIWDEEGLVRDRRFHDELADGDGIDEELRREASYLKLCGAISETPAELRNEQSYENNLEDTNECDNKPTSGPPANCKMLFEAVSSEGFEETHSLRCELSEPNTEDVGHHHGAHSASSEKRVFQNIQQKPLDSSGSPFPTPLVLRDDMQTPGTAYASHRGTSISGKRVRTRKQFIFPVLRSIENRLQQTEPTKDSSPLASFNPLKGGYLEGNSIKDTAQMSSTSVVKSGLSKTPSYSPLDANTSYEVKEAPSPDELLDGKGLQKSNSDERNAALSLSHWAKSSSTDAENQGDVNCATEDQSYYECSFLSEGPVFMASDLNMDIGHPTPRLPKAWDGNGIPNTTTRYKEDQKVNWHTTPFENRLLKVLSDEERCSSRKVVRGKLFHLEEKAE